MQGIALMKAGHVAILGSGIMGSSAALALAARGIRVTLFEARERPFQGASRWNEGKIHLGYTYSAHRSLQTARHLIPGGLAFKRLTERHIGQSIESAVTTHDDTYLIHHDSVTSVAEMESYVAGVDALLAEEPRASDYIGELKGNRSRRLSSAELAQSYNTEKIHAGFRVPEKSVSTLWLADKFVQALEAEPKIELALKTRVTGVQPSKGSMDGPFQIETDAGAAGPFDFVINALWEGRPAIDAGLGILPPAPWSHRLRLVIFVQTDKPLSVPSTVIATGPFGDIKRYPGRDFYLSWYAAGLLAEGTALAPPPVPELNETDKQKRIDAIFHELGAFIPGVKAVQKDAQAIQFEGGWVYACGQGALSDPASTLHRRDSANIHRAGGYISIDTGKYSIAPWLAEQVAAAICS
jgi:glycine/D-amino acid oxidase-like deaminating enzyme